MRLAPPSLWDAALEHRRTIVVRAVGSDLVLLDDCNVPGGYEYHGGTAQKDTQALRQSDGLQAGLPWVQAGLEKSGESYIDTTVVGRFTSMLRYDMPDDRQRPPRRYRWIIA